MKYLSLIAYLATIPGANWMIGHVGTSCIPDGPCVIPVAPGFYAPSGVLLVGAALVLRDVVQQSLGMRWTVSAIVAGVLLSALVAPPSLVLASAVAFAIAETLDLLVYTPLRARNLSLAILASGLVGSFADSAAFLLIAFGSLQFIEGQFIGKAWITLFAVIAIYVFGQAKKLSAY